jgi:hypothetical protein
VAVVIVTVTISPRNIRDGAPHSACNCAAALALRHALPGREIEVWSDVIVVDGVEVPTPPALAAWMEAYDELRSVDPLTFELDVPEKAA